MFGALKSLFGKRSSLSPKSIGGVISDGTIYAGISPDTGEAIYAAPSDAPLCMSFDAASKYAKKLMVGFRDDFRVPSKSELNVLFENREKGALKGTFNLTGSETSGFYWSSTPIDENYAWDQRFSDGAQNHGYYSSRALHASVRCIRAEKIPQTNASTWWIPN